MTGYKIDLRIKVNRRWEELEKQQPNHKLPQTYKEALIELLWKVEENEKLQLENTQQKQIIGELQPKAAYYDEILKSPKITECQDISLISSYQSKKSNTNNLSNGCYIAIIIVRVTQKVRLFQ